MRRKSQFARIGFSFLVVCFVLCFSGASMAEDKPYQIEISSLWPATNIYANAVFWAKLINENSQLVEAVAREGKGPNVDMKTLVRYPDQRKKLVFFGDEDSWWGAQQGLPGWKEFVDKYDFNNFRHLALIGFTVDVMLTAKNDIKTMYDMNGKSFVASSRNLNNAKSLGFIETFKLAGVKPEVKALGTRPMIESCRDGLIDVIHGGILLTGPSQFMPSPYLNELFATRKIHPVSFDVKYLKAMKEKTGHPGIIVQFPPKSINKYQDSPVFGLGKALMWDCDKSIPDKVVTEILRVYYENIEKFGSLNPGGKILTKKSMAAAGIPESRFHPAAVKFYKEKGVPITFLQELGYLKLIE